MADIEWEEDSEDELPQNSPQVKVEESYVQVKLEPADDLKTPTSQASVKTETYASSPSGSVKPKKKTPEMRAQLSETVRQREAFLDLYDYMESQALGALSRKFRCPATIANMSCQFQLGVPVDLTRMALAAPNAELNPGIRNSLLISLRSPDLSVQVQKSGYVSILGGKTRATLYTTGRRIASIARRSNAAPYARFFAFRINNIVVTFRSDIKFRLDVLHALLEPRAREIQRELLTTYEKEIFPAMTVQIKRPTTVSFKVFSTGVFIAMGAEQVADVVEVVEWLYPLMRQISEDAIVSSSGTYGAYTVNPMSIEAAMEKQRSMDTDSVDDNTEHLLGDKRKLGAKSSRRSRDESVLAGEEDDYIEIDHMLQD